MDAYSSSHSEWNADKNWSSQEVRTGRLVYEQPPGLFTEHTDKFIVDDDDMDSGTVAESDMSLKSRSFMHRVNDRVRKIQDQSSKDATQDSNKHFSIKSHGEELLRQFTVHQKYRKRSHNETDVRHI